MKLFIDDVRTPPDDAWMLARDSLTAMRLLTMYEFDEISFDHDLGEEHWDGGEIAYLFMSMCHSGMIKKMPKWFVHSANPVGVKRITQHMSLAEKILEEHHG